MKYIFIISLRLICSISIVLFGFTGTAFSQSDLSYFGGPDQFAAQAGVRLTVPFGGQLKRIEDQPRLGFVAGFTRERAVSSWQTSHNRTVLGGTTIKADVLELGMTFDGQLTTLLLGQDMHPLFTGRLNATDSDDKEDNKGGSNVGWYILGGLAALVVVGGIAGGLARKEAIENLGDAISGIGSGS